MNIKRSTGFYPTFERSGSVTRSTHYCAGCGHGILHKLIAEAMVDLHIQDRTIFISPIGCAVFGYYYMDCGNIGAAHGRAPCVGTALARTLKDKVVIVYQGDGDLGAIGFNNCFQAASRGERIVTFFVNNAIYGMTGGQMAPTTLRGQRTATSPLGRNPLTDGYPLHACEVLNQLEAPVYIERCSLADNARVMKARKAVRKALELQRDGKGYAFVEFLSPCPTNMGMDAAQSAQFVSGQLEQEYPLGCLRDRSAEAQPPPAPEPRPTVAEYFGVCDGAPDPQPDPTVGERRIKFAGFGGQGILSLGLVVAEAGRRAGRFTSWFPSYGPEQRGGAASCSVVIAGQPVGSPDVEKIDVLVAMNQPSVERFARDVKPGGLMIYDASVPATVIHTQPGVRTLAIPAMEIATKEEVPKAGNTVMLAALDAGQALGISRDVLLAALDASFRKKPVLIPKNRRVFEAGQAWIASHTP